jgi:hypothetical protein
MGEPIRFYKNNPDQEDRYSLVEYLRTVSGWVTAREIMAATGLSAKRVRELAQIYPAMLVSSSAGYKLTVMATSSEKIQCVQSLIARGEKIIARAAQLAGTL